MEKRVLGTGYRADICRHEIDNFDAAAGIVVVARHMKLLCNCE